MLDFFKFLRDSIFLMFDYLVGNVDKTPYEQRLAWFTLGGGAIFVACFLLMLLKLAPDRWSYRKTVLISLLSGVPLTILYFFIVYVCL